MASERRQAVSICEFHLDLVRKVESLSERVIRLEQISKDRDRSLQTIKDDLDEVRDSLTRVNTQLAGLPTKLITATVTIVGTVLAILHNLPVLSKLLN